MSIIVEDGTGLATAESFVTVAEFKTYCDNRGYSYAGKSDADIEKALRLGADYVNTTARYKGSRLVITQSLEFPRAQLVDWSGITVTGVPLRVKNAQIELAFKGLSEVLYSDLERGGRIKSESVGPISTTYMDDAPVQKLYALAMNYLKPFVRADDMDMINGPNFGGGTEGYFQIGMHDNEKSAPDATDDLIN